MDLQDWLEYGRAEGFITGVYCDTHDGVPMTEAEMDDWQDGDDPCHHSVRIIGHDESLKELARNK